MKRDVTSRVNPAPALFRRLRRDHARVLGQVGGLESTLTRPMSPKRRAALERGEFPRVLALLEEQFATHMAAEDRSLYPALLDAIPAAAASIEPLLAEHAELRQMLSRLLVLSREPASPARSEQIRIQVVDFADLLRLHIQKEEFMAFRLAPRLLTPREIAAVAAHLERKAEPASRKPPTRSKGASR